MHTTARIKTTLHAAAKKNHVLLAIEFKCLPSPTCRQKLHVAHWLVIV